MKFDVPKMTVNRRLGGNVRPLGYCRIFVLSFFVTDVCVRYLCRMKIRIQGLVSVNPDRICMNHTLNQTNAISVSG